MWIHRLPYRITQTGQGGGGPLSVDKMRKALLLTQTSQFWWKGLSVTRTGPRLLGILQALSVVQWKPEGFRVFKTWPHLCQTQALQA